VDLHGKIIDQLTNCGRKEEQLGLLLVILPEDGCSYGMEVIAVSYSLCFWVTAIFDVLQTKWKGCVRRLELHSTIVVPVKLCIQARGILRELHVQYSLRSSFPIPCDFCLLQNYHVLGLLIRL